MTTIKEYKAMIKGTTEGPWTYEPQEFTPECVWKGTKKICHVIGDSGETESNAQFIAASRNIAPELIRVIELAEEALNYALSQMQPFCSNAKVTDALSEIKKLKGDA